MDFLITLIGVACATFILCAIASAPLFFKEMLPEPFGTILSILLFMQIVAITICIIFRSKSKNKH